MSDKPYRPNVGIALFNTSGQVLIGFLQPLTDVDLASIKYYHFAIGTVAGIPDIIVSRTGYTGEDGFEIMVPAAEWAFWGDEANASKALGMQFKSQFEAANREEFIGRVQQATGIEDSAVSALSKLVQVMPPRLRRPSNSRSR